MADLRIVQAATSIVEGVATGRLPVVDREAALAEVIHLASRVPEARDPLAALTSLDRRVGEMLRERFPNPPSLPLGVYVLSWAIRPRRDVEIYTTATVVATSPFEARHRHPDPDLSWNGRMWVGPEGEWDDGAWPSHPDGVVAARFRGASMGERYGAILSSTFIPG